LLVGEPRACSCPISGSSANLFPSLTELASHLTITKEAHVTGFDVSLSLVLTDSRIRRALQTPFNAIGSRVDGTTGPLARSRPLDTSRTSCPSTTTSKGYPGYRTAHIASIPITAVCSAGQHSEEKNQAPLFLLFVPIVLSIQVETITFWTGFGCSPFFEIPPFTRSTTRLHRQLFTSTCQSRWRTKTSTVTWIPVIQGSSVHFTQVTLSSYRRTLTSITPSYATTCWTLCV
jgi:hypothetical protein